jgi:hypothetical protein
MRTALLLSLQAAAPSPAAPLLDTGFDLAKVRPAEPGDGCRPGTAGTSDIIVCGRRRSNGYPYEKMERLFAEEPLRAEVTIAPGVKLNLSADSVAMPEGQVSKRATVGVKIAF